MQSHFRETKTEFLRIYTLISSGIAAALSTVVDISIDTSTANFHGLLQRLMDQTG